MRRQLVIYCKVTSPYACHTECRKMASSPSLDDGNNRYSDTEIPLNFRIPVPHGKPSHRDGLRAPTTRERSVSHSGFRVIGLISCKKYLNPTWIGLIPSENPSTPGRERTGGSSRPSGSG